MRPQTKGNQYICCHYLLLRMKKILIALTALLVIHTNLNAQIKNSEEETSDKSVNCGGVERWAVKVLADAAVNTINFTPVNTTVNGMVSIVTPPPSTTMPRYAGVEDITYRLVCKITIKKNESDDDYHLVLSDGTHTFIGEIPNPLCAMASTTAFVDQYITCRNFVNTYIPQANNNNVNIADVEVTGVAFVDPAHGQTGKAPNNIEFHPILDIHFAGTTQVEELQAEKVLSVSLTPNPAQGKVLVNIKSKSEVLKSCDLQLFDIQANCIGKFSLPVNGNKTISETIDLKNIAAGVYIYKILNNGMLLYDGKLLVY